MGPGDYRIRFTADQDFLGRLRAEAEQHPETLRILSDRPEADATRLGFDLVTVATVVTIIAGTVQTIDLAVKLFRWWQASTSNKVIVQTQVGVFELRRATPVTEEEVCKLLEGVRKPQP
jgi:hypothetical protein